jgi:hypothetical protein
MTIVRVGTNARYADGWLDAFGKGKSSKGSAAKASKKKSPAKKAKKRK